MTVDQVVEKTEMLMDRAARDNRDRICQSLGSQGFEQEYVEAVLNFLHAEHDRSKANTLSALRIWLERWEWEGYPPAQGPFEQQVN